MATAAQAMSGLDASVPDAMDILSDSGYDFGDGDIDLDLEPVGSVTHDDDLSIHDAGTDNGLDVQTAPADHDDFMADNEDLIEEDVSINNDVNIVSNNQDPLGASMSQQQSLAPPEEDLIDYSDDEGMQHEDQDTNSYHESSRGEQVEHNEEYTIQQSSQHESTDALHVANDYEEKDDNHGYEPEEEDQVEEEQDPNEHDREKLAPALQDQQQAEGADWEQEHLTPVQGYETYEAGDDFNGQITNLQAGNLYDDENAEHQDDEQLMNQVQLNEQADTEEDGQNDQGYICPPVSVGYSGRDFWLFRQHDTENSGEWLLEDMTLAEGELSHVFQACRASIGQDVTVETELGFRFDHMHNMELYEDNTVCAYVTLQRLVDLYHTLLAQDDIAEPEEFYITLLFRPRFFTLLGEMEKYAQEGHGFMKLNADIAAGETHFSNIFSTASTKHGYGEWENNGEGAEEEGEQHGDENQHETQDDLQHNDEHQEEHETIGDKSREETHEASDEEQKDGTNFARSASQEDELHDTTTSYPETTNITSDTSHSMNNLQGNVESPAQDDNNSRHESASAGESQPDEGEDLIDYSDDDDAGHDEDPENNSRDGASTSSSTVQGEESLDPANMVDAPDSAVQSSHEGNENDDEEDADDEDLSAQYADLDAPDHSYQGQNYGQELYQGEDQAYNSPERLEAYEPNENQEYSAQPDLEGDTNEYYGDHEDQDADEQIFSTLPVDAPDNDTTGAVDSATVDGLIGVEDYMNVGDATLPGLDDDDNILSTFPDDSAEILDPSVEFPDQDGVVEQPAVTVSPVAEPIATSSVEPKGLSPQRQKRTIDEVSNELGEASDSIDAKRPRV